MFAGSYADIAVLRRYAANTPHVLLLDHVGGADWREYCANAAVGGDRGDRPRRAADTLVNALKDNAIPRARTVSDIIDRDMAAYIRRPGFERRRDAAIIMMVAETPPHRGIGADTTDIQAAMTLHDTMPDTDPMPLAAVRGHAATAMTVGETTPLTTEIRRQAATGATGPRLRRNIDKSSAWRNVENAVVARLDAAAAALTDPNIEFDEMRRLDDAADNALAHMPWPYARDVETAYERWRDAHDD